MDFVPIAELPDWEKRIARQDAFWNREVLDRPVVSMVCRKTAKAFPWKHPVIRDNWTDADFQLEKALFEVRNRCYLGDALPFVCPNLGPDFFSACFSDESVLLFREDTSHLLPFVEDVERVKGFHWREENRWIRIMDRLYDAFLEGGKHSFYTGLPDLHPGADALAGFRGAESFCLDLYDKEHVIPACLRGMHRNFLRLYDHYYQKIASANQPVAQWPGIVSSEKWHVPCNDFSFMISREMFDAYFLETACREIDAFERTLWHLDGPGTLKHLNSLLAIEKLDAVQWVSGAGNGRCSDWIPVYKKIQQEGKGIQILGVQPQEMETLMEALRPEGVWMEVLAEDEEEGDRILKAVRRWI